MDKRNLDVTSCRVSGHVSHERSNLDERPGIRQDVAAVERLLEWVSDMHVTEDEVSEYLSSGGSDKVAAARLNGHLARCPACRIYFRLMSRRTTNGAQLR